ncbi:myosin-binding striated muscle assembly central-domain-containing protein [Podospora aff. communis PSN243]|uniref:Myosin-binding striated muscle assembly central-domain-containing protein n=1 Tax=Podospora aff. communis PSN243 TaxID=3040156 RepID=A0AAV9H470_9PEZI|nr:myosin-binding striated muscle assembly central-domain-containing protein [Podospora aff. communis PSN243]
MATAAAPPSGSPEPEYNRQDQTLLLFARLMEGGLEDDETVSELGKLTKLLHDDIEHVKKGEPSITTVIDGDCVDTILCYLDMRQPDVVRGHAAMCTSEYLKAAGEDGSKKLAEFFHDRVRRGTYDDFIVAFCVAATIFPIVPDLTSELFLSEGFLPSLGPLMRRKWKSRKVETACLEMLNAACMNSLCRDAVQKYCTEWLEEIIDQDPEEVVKELHHAEPGIQEGSISMRRHSLHVQNLAAVVLAKLRAVQTAKPPDGTEPRVQAATTSVEDLSKMFTKTLLTNPEHGAQSSIEGLAYASLQPKVKEELSKNKEFLQTLVKTLEGAPPKSPLTYGALSIFANLTVYRPVETEEEKRMSQLKAYANAAGKLQPEPLNDHEHTTERCKRVFEAGVVPVLVSHSKSGSLASLSLIISIIHALSTTIALRGQLAQQGAVRLLIAAWAALPEKEQKVRRTAAQALARILITTNPTIVFGGNRPIPQANAIRPLASIITSDPDAETRDLLPTFEALMALTNLASTDNDTCHSIVRLAWDDIEEQLLSPNSRVTTAAVELICNLVQNPEDAMALYGDGKAKANNRLKILVALADAEDPATRSAAGGALAGLTGYEPIVRAIATRERGPEIVLGLCSDESEDIRHRGVFVVCNMVTANGEAGKLAKEKLLAAGAVQILTECAKKSRRAEVVEVTVQALKMMLKGK